MSNPSDHSFYFDPKSGHYSPPGTERPHPCPMDDYNPKKWSFGDKIENAAASHDNPTRIGFFIRRRVRGAQLNSGAYVEMTDGRGSFWESNARHGHQLTRIEHTSVRAR